MQSGRQKVLDADTIDSARRTVACLNEFLVTAMNEPSVGIYYIGENIRETIPKLVRNKNKLLELQEVLSSQVYGLDFCSNIVKDLEEFPNFERILQRVTDAADLAGKVYDQRVEAKRGPRKPKTPTVEQTPGEPLVVESDWTLENDAPEAPAHFSPSPEPEPAVVEYPASPAKIETPTDAAAASFFDDDDDFVVKKF